MAHKTNRVQNRTPRGVFACVVGMVALVLLGLFVANASVVGAGPRACPIPPACPVPPARPVDVPPKHLGAATGQARGPAPTMFTPTPVCGSGADYVITQSTGVIESAATDIGNHCDECVTVITLPFSYLFYGTPYTTANVSANGNLQFSSSFIYLNVECLPTIVLDNAILAHWDDLRTNQLGNCSSYASGGCGIFTSTSGNAPNRVFNIEWRTTYFRNNEQLANFEVRLYEGQNKFDIVYAQVEQAGENATVGVQNGIGPQATQFGCNTGGIVSGLLLTFEQPSCVSPTPATTYTVTVTGTPPTNTPTFTPTRTPTITPTRTPTPTVTLTVTGTPPTAAPTNTQVPNLIIGHLTWQGIAQPNVRNEGVTGTLTLCYAGAPYSYTAATDVDGAFNINVDLPNGTYAWRFKGPKWLANSGTIALSGTVNQEFGVQRAGDANHSNIIEVQDFVILKATFGKSLGDPGYDSRPDFNNDNTITAADFTLLKGNFGVGGALPICSILQPLPS